MSTVTLGGDRLGSGKDIKVNLPEFSRSTHDLGYLWRSTMASGTLVPFMKEIALPGDTHEINLMTEVLTHPTIGPLFGSYKVQLDVFSIPMGLYQAEVITNQLEIGLDMQSLKMPIMRLTAQDHNDKPFEMQINPSSLLSYLDIVGLGKKSGVNNSPLIMRDFNAIGFLAYWDIFKQYYANKQEDNAYYIKANTSDYEINPDVRIKFMKLPEATKLNTIMRVPATQKVDMNVNMEFQIKGEIAEWNENEFLDNLKFRTNISEETDIREYYTDVYTETEVVQTYTKITLWAKGWKREPNVKGIEEVSIGYEVNKDYLNREPILKPFPLKNIDEMRKIIIRHESEGNPLIINQLTSQLAPYTEIDDNNEATPPNRIYGKQFGQELLAVKTYQSDLFNNWINTEWIDGDNGINEITKVNVEDGLKINDLILHKKLYDMLNNIAVSGGSYDNWLNATYNQERIKQINSPMYHGSLIKELTFDEVVSNSATDEQPLGTLAGRGRLTSKHKGGYVKIKTDEPSLIMGIISLTPRIDYSQGNKWDTQLFTWDDFHKPQLDSIGFQDLITDQMLYTDTKIDAQAVVHFKSAGKQPAWINYQTNLNKTKGNFAIETEQMWMTLNRQYEQNRDGSIKDLTTYIDPVKYNNIFAYTRRDAQNFWAQIKVDMKVRRKMSANIMPNL